MALRKNRPGSKRQPDRRGLIAVIGGLILLLICSAGYRPLLGRVASSASSIDGSFSLVDAQGRDRSNASFRGRYMLIFFGYTTCADVCPQTLTEMSEALDRIDPQADRIQPIFITIDPKHDTPERLRAYTAAFSRNLVGLTGTTAKLGDAERRFHVVAEPDQVDGTDGFDHSAVLYLLGPDGRFIAPLSADADRTVLQAELQRYVPAGTAGRT